MGLQLTFSHGTGSMMAALCGVLAGLTYRSNIFRLKRFRVECRLTDHIECLCSFLVSSIRCCPRRSDDCWDAVLRGRLLPSMPLGLKDDVLKFRTMECDTRYYLCHIWIQTSKLPNACTLLNQISIVICRSGWNANSTCHSIQPQIGGDDCRLLS